MTNPSPKSTLKRYPLGSIFQGFGENKTDYTKYGYPNGHPGWDVLAYQGAPIVSITDGTVVYIKTDAKSIGGISIWILSSDKKYIFSYGHLQEVSVPLGREVKEGEQIGKMGNTGFIISGGTSYWGNAPAGKGVHLHFNISPLKRWKNINNFTLLYPDNGTAGAVDPTPFFAETIKPEVPDQRAIMQKIIEAYRSIVRIFGKEPVA